MRIHSTPVKLCGDREVPARVYYYQNPYMWLKVNWQMFKLKLLNKEFNPNEFNRGSVQAISTVTDIVATGHLDRLQGLLSPTAIGKLKGDMTRWTDEMVRHVGVKASDLKLAVPTKVHISTLSSRRVCNIDMWYLAIKWRDLDNVILMDLVARFQNEDFTNTHNTDWTITVFELRRYHVQSYSREEE